MKTKSPILDKAWSKYYQAVEDARSAIESTERFQSHPECRAQGYHSLMEAQSMAYNQVIAPRLNNPRIYTHTFFNTTLLSVGQPSSDCLYSLLPLDGRQTYRLTLRQGEIKVMLLQAYSHMLGHPESQLTGNYDVSNFSASSKGDIEIIFSARQQESNWIPLAEESNFNYIILRRFFSDWFDNMGELDIEMSSTLADYDESNEESMAERIAMAADFITYQINVWTIGLYDLYIQNASGKNQFWCFQGSDAPDILGNSSTSYGVAVATCEPDEAVIVEMDAPDSVYWGMMAGCVWSKPLENVFNQSDINMARAALDPDGKFRAVFCHPDPCLANWIDILGRREFTICLRNYKETAKNPISAPTLKSVKFSKLREHLPPDTRTITPAERQKNITHRRDGFIRLYDTVNSSG